MIEVLLSYFINSIVPLKMSLETHFTSSGPARDRTVSELLSHRDDSNASASSKEILWVSHWSYSSVLVYSSPIVRIVL